MSIASLAVVVVIGRNIVTNSNSAYWSKPTIVGANLALLLVFMLPAAWGCVTIIGRHKEKMLFWNLLLLIYLGLTPLLGEGILRAGIAIGPDIFREPNIYADRFADVDNFKLRALWHPSDAPRFVGRSNLEYDQLLGWSFPRTAENPLGVLSELPYEIDLEKRPVVFLGDSFTALAERLEDNIPQLLDEMLPELRVHNYGVGGYGLDQIYLRFRESHPLFEDPIVLFGLMTTDIDRCLLDFRDAPKPYFEIDGEELVLKGVPVAPDKARYLEEEPPRLKSYFLAALKRTFRYVVDGGSSMEGQYRRAEKEALAARILDRVVADARRHDLKLVFVVFSPRQGGGWRKNFLLEEFRRLGAEYIDAEEALVEVEARARRPRADSYDATGHHTSWANREIAKAIREYMIDADL